MLLLVRTLPERLIQPSHVHFKLTLNFSLFKRRDFPTQAWSGGLAAVVASVKVHQNAPFSI